ncbi:hypothetical protein COPEUT_02430 [Coprococcus eutactus ATCC 27759]|nr:hypothetical protein COPEUT_02430 [Coprococcus eutactus ATCC 27759]
MTIYFSPSLFFEGQEGTPASQKKRGLLQARFFDIINATVLQI